MAHAKVSTACLVWFPFLGAFWMMYIAFNYQPWFERNFPKPKFIGMLFYHLMCLEAGLYIYYSVYY